MTAPAAITIPVSFIGEAPVRALTVDEAGFRALVGIANKSEDAMRMESWRYRSEMEIPKLPGGRYLVADVERGLREMAARRRAN